MVIGQHRINFMTKTGERVTNNEKLKQVNAALVYQLIDLQGPISRVEIVQLSALAPASVTNITRQLMDSGLITEVAQQASTGGRPAISLTTLKSSFYFISCRLGREELQYSVMDLEGNLHYHRMQPLENHDSRGIVDSLRAAIQDCIQHHHQLRFIAVALTMAGLLDPATGTVQYSPNHQIQGLNLSGALTEFNLPVYIGNDIRARALVENYLGAAKNCEDFILVNIHNGIGAGIVSNGQLLLGKQRTVGEIGHVQIDQFGQQCHCGNFGCLETVVSNQAIVQQVNLLLERGHDSILKRDHVTINSVGRAALKGDAVAIEIIRKAGHHLGHVLAMLVNVFNPEKILFSGELLESDSILFPIIQKQIAHQSLPSFANALTLEKALYQDQGTIGGFALMKRALHQGDLLQHMLKITP
jgi:N-acetylglucosamine repressor